MIMALKNSADTPLNWINHFTDQESSDRARSSPLIETVNNKSLKEHFRFIKNLHKEEKRERKKTSILPPFGKKQFDGEKTKVETQTSLRTDRACAIHSENEHLKLVRKKEEKRKKKSSIATFFGMIQSHENESVTGDDSNLLDIPGRCITVANVSIEARERNTDEVNYREHLLLERENDTRLFYPHFTTYYLISPKGDEHDELYLDINIEPIRKNMNPLKDINATHYIVYSVINMTHDYEEEFLLISTEPIRSYDWYTNPMKQRKKSSKIAPMINERKTNTKDKTHNLNRVNALTDTDKKSSKLPISQKYLQFGNKVMYSHSTGAKRN